MTARFQLTVAALVLATTVPAAGQEMRVSDRILVVVDEDPILSSEVDQLIGLGLVEREDGEDDEAYHARVLNRLVDQRLRFHEIDRFGFAELPIQEVERQYQAFRERLGGGEPLDERLAELGLDESRLKQLIARQIMVVTYVEERLGPRVFVGLDDITAYYDNVLSPEMDASGQPLPPVSDVREQIREVLKQQRLNEELERWTEELRQKADIADYSTSRRDEPPPIEVEGG